MDASQHQKAVTADADKAPDRRDASSLHAPALIALVGVLARQAAAEAFATSRLSAIKRSEKDTKNDKQ